MKKLISVLVVAVLVLTMAGCGGQTSQNDVSEGKADQGSGSEAKQESGSSAVFTIWWSENDMDAGFNAAVEKFKEMHPDVEVNVEKKTSMQMVDSGQMVLNSKDVPDIVQTNKGNATLGLYSQQGLVQDLSAEAESRGWLEVLTPALQPQLRYEEGIMGSGKLWSITTYGEYVMMYYNKDMFETRGLEVPTTLEELESVCDAFVAEGITPISLGAQDVWPQSHNWFEYLNYKATPKMNQDYQYMGDDIDFEGPEFTYAAEKYKEAFDKGYISIDANGTSYENANAAFIQQKTPMTLTGSWMLSFMADSITDFEWDVFNMPDKTMVTGSIGDPLIVPAKAKNKALAYDFIDIVLSEDIQSTISNSGAIAINPNFDSIEDESILKLHKGFADILENGTLALYPDFPTPGIMDVIGQGLQTLATGEMTVEEFNKSLSDEYYGYKNNR